MDEKRVRQRLLSRRDELRRQVVKIERDFRHESDPLSKLAEDQVSQTENDDVLDALDASGRRELESIERALARLEDGEYGVCARCGEPIAPSRLRALPTAEDCIRCAEASSA